MPSPIPLPMWAAIPDAADTSVKVPMIIAQPGRVPQGEVCGALLSHYDLMPTLTDYLGIDNPVQKDLPGHSFADILRGQSISSKLSARSSQTSPGP